MPGAWVLPGPSARSLTEAAAPNYPARVRVVSGDISVNGSVPVLAAGMSATIEIKTGTWRVIVFLRSPVMRAMNEAGRER